MTKTRENRLIAMLLAVTLLSGRIHAADQASPVDALIGGENAFALDLYGQLKSGDGNLFFSPYSISTCLGMTYAGARGKTAQQMAQTLHFNAGPTELGIPMGQLRKDLNKIGQENGIELNTANGLWAQAGDAFLPAFLEIAQQQFGATINQADFRKHAEPARKEINDWVSKQTKDKINDLIAPGMLTSATSLVLVNAIYFKGKWVHPFDKAATADAPFTLGSGQKLQAKMMHVEAAFGYAETEDLQLLKMDYSTGKKVVSSAAEAKEWGPLFNRLSMVVLLPKEVNGLKKLEDQLNADALDHWISQAHGQQVKVFVPKFKMTREFKLSQTLDRMGMTVAFTPQADFSGMNGKRDLFISDVVHKAYVDVYEEGTEAAAATGVTMSRAVAVPRPTPTFRADHPFIFLIRDNASGAILFLGRVNDPTK